MHIRSEQPGDQYAIRHILEQAFAPRQQEADLVEALRQQPEGQIALVAVLDEIIVGHILFTPAEIMPHQPVKLAALGPVAVLPEHQNQKIGSKLIESGLDECQKMGYEAVVVLGHSDYYPRFGFVTSTEYGLRCEWEVPEPAFMVKALSEGALKKQEGIVKYLPAFSNV